MTNQEIINHLAKISLNLQIKIADNRDSIDFCALEQLTLKMCYEHTEFLIAYFENVQNRSNHE